MFLIQRQHVSEPVDVPTFLECAHARLHLIDETFQALLHLLILFLICQAAAAVLSLLQRGSGRLLLFFLSHLRFLGFLL